MKGSLNTCTLTSDSYNYYEMMKELQNTYGFEQIGEGGFGVVMGAANGCAIKLVKDLNRCKELEKEKIFYETIEQNKNDKLLGRIPSYNLFKVLNTFCHFNTEKIYSPLSEYDESEYKTRVGYVIGELNDMYVFRDMKSSRGTYTVEKTNVNVKQNRRIVHFYVNHYDVNFKDFSDERGNLYGLKHLENAFSIDNVKEYCYVLGQLVSFMLFDCGIYPFDVEVVIGTSEKDRVCTLYMYDFNECLFVNDLVDIVAAKSLYNKDGKFMYPNKYHIHYEFFVQGLISDRSDKDIIFIESMLNHYNDLFYKV